MPTLDKLAGAGLRYNRFHTTALCSPTRVALLTGRNHHVNNAGAITELATGFAGNTGIRPNSVIVSRPAAPEFTIDPLGECSRRPARCVGLSDPAAEDVVVIPAVVHARHGAMVAAYGPGQPDTR